MIKATPNTCCGCSACAQRCPKQCITMQADGEGFLYPVVNAELCIDCGLCEIVCPCLNQSKLKTPITVQSFEAKDAAVRKQSSSGGAFTLLAEHIINKGGMVFGARFDDNWNVVHDYTETVDGLKAFRGSKYVQSVISDCYQKAEVFLKAGREVMFSGTPCQIAGLKHYLRKDYANLLSVDIACHSVPSPFIWQEYLKGIKTKDIADINFRDKRKGWERYGLSIANNKGSAFFQEHDSNSYMQLFLHGITVRPSCFDCPAKDGRSGADITLGDCWGILKMVPGYPNVQQGVSFVICNTEKGQAIATEANVNGHELSYQQIVASNGGLTVKAKIPKERAAFWKAFQSAAIKQQVINQFAKPYMPSIVLRLKLFISRMLNRK